MEKTAAILERDEEKLSIEELQKENTELYKELFPQNYTHCWSVLKVIFVNSEFREFNSVRWHLTD